MPNPAGDRNIQYDWQRFWIPQTGVLNLSDAGFLRDPLDDRLDPSGLRALHDDEASPLQVLHKALSDDFPTSTFLPLKVKLELRAITYN